MALRSPSSERVGCGFSAEMRMPALFYENKKLRLRLLKDGVF